MYKQQLFVIDTPEGVYVNAVKDGPVLSVLLRAAWAVFVHRVKTTANKGLCKWASK